MAGEDQQREIVLGNKQLLSVFFIVVAMMGVAFTIGYIIGRNGGNVSAASLGSAFGSGTAGSSKNAPLASAPVTAPDDAPPQTSTPVPVQIPSKETPPAESPAASPAPATAQQVTSAPDVATSEKPAPEKTDDRKSASGAIYLQVAALKRQDAEHIVHVLSERHFPARLGESPKEGLFRVLVGPFATMQALADTKSKLRAAGFDSIVAR